MNDIVPKSDLTSGENSSSPIGRKKICIVTGEIEGPSVNGGVGTANRSQACVLCSLGYDVDILYTRVEHGNPYSACGNFTDHVEAFRKLGIGLTCIDNQGNFDDWLALSYLSMQHLLHHRYDLVFFDDLFGTAYYSLLARRTGNAKLRDTMMCVALHSSMEWLADLGQPTVTRVEDLQRAEMERRSIELADTVRAPSEYILKKYRSYGWTIPSSSIVLPNLVCTDRPLGQCGKRTLIKEIVFFGRLETRKGLWMFCRALDRLKYKLSDYQVTFLGKATFENGMSTAARLVRYSATWPFTVRLLTNFDRAQALAYLKAPARLAVMPSPEDNSPSTIVECLEEGIPFIACSGSGGEELLDEDSRKASLFKPSVDQLCAKLLEIFERGALTSHASFDQVQLQGKFAEWLGCLLDAGARPPSPVSRSPQVQTSILIVLVPREIPSDQAAARLRLALQSYDGRVQIEALTATSAEELQKHLASESASLPIKINNVADFEKISQAVVLQKPTVAGICHITQMLPYAWLERAGACFGAEKSISALTGMAAVNKISGIRIRAPHVSTSNEIHEIERYLVGYAPPLFTVSQETNSGFVLMRSEALAKCGGLGPIDERYDRLKRMQDWIHEILLMLHASGERFELVPDEIIAPPIKEPQFEVFRIERLTRTLPSKFFGYAPGSDQSVLARLAIDVGLQRERSFAHDKYVRDISERIGTEVPRLPLYGPWETQARQLAMIAHASGQIALAIDICTELAIQDELFKPVRVTEYIRLAAAGEIINLVEAATADNKGANNDRRQVEMWVNPAWVDLNAFTVPRLDLSRVTHFTSVIEVPGSTADPVRFRIELNSRDKLHYWSADKVVVGGEQSLWEIECPSDLRCECAIRFGVEMADCEARSEGQIARWINPRFERR